MNCSGWWLPLLAVACTDAVDGNSPPSAEASLFPAAPLTDDRLEASWSTSDPDGDPVTVERTWTVDGIEVAAGVDELGGEHFSRGQTVAFRVIPDDGRDVGPAAVAEVVIGDTPPTLFGATVEPSLLDVTAVASCGYIGWSDADGDPPAFHVSWLVNGVSAGEGTTLAAPAFARGDEVACVLVPTSGADGLPVESPPRVVGNAPPSPATASVQSANGADPRWGVDDLLCSAGSPAIDPDGDPITYTAAWSSPHDPVLEGITTVMANDTLPAGVADAARSITCTMTASDGVDVSIGVPATIEPEPVGGNILLIIVDDVGVDKISVYAEHPDVPSTPNIDQLAAEGVLFRNAYASPACSPTRANLFTGRYGRRTGIGKIIDYWEYNYALPNTEIGLPAMLATSPDFAYTSSLTGKWHLGSAMDGPSYAGVLGFDWYAGSLGNLQERSAIGLDGGYGYYQWERNENGVIAVETTYATVSTTDDALDRIAEMPEPWFLLVSYNAAHKPVHLPPDELFTGPYTTDSTVFDKVSAMVESVDTEIGRLLAGIDPTVLADTHVVFTADNGTPDHAVTAPFDPVFAKGSVHEGGVGVPLIVKSPLVGVPGAESAAFVHAVDLYTTFAVLAGVDVRELRQVDLAGNLLPITVDGDSFLPYLADPGAPGARTTLYTEFFKPNGNGPFNEDLRAVRGERYKLVRTLVGEVYVDELFDLWVGPVEGADLLTAGPLSPEAKAAYASLALALDEIEATVVYDVPEHLPEVGLVQISPESPTAADTLTCTAETRDSDGDTIAALFAWSVDGSVVSVQIDTLDPVFFSAGSEVTCTVTPTDGASNGSSLSKTVQISG